MTLTNDLLPRKARPWRPEPAERLLARERLEQIEPRPEPARRGGGRRQPRHAFDRRPRATRSTGEPQATERHRLGRDGRIALARQRQRLRPPGARFEPKEGGVRTERPAFVPTHPARLTDARRPGQTPGTAAKHQARRVQHDERRAPTEIDHEGCKGAPDRVGAFDDGAVATFAFAFEHEAGADVVLICPRERLVTARRRAIRDVQIDAQPRPARVRSRQGAEVPRPGPRAKRDRDRPEPEPGPPSGAQAAPRPGASRRARDP